MNRKDEELKEKQISEVMLSIENRVRHAYNQGYEQGLKASKQESCEQIKWERDTAIKQLNELGYGLGEKIEPCEDCISRKALLDAIYQKEYGTDYYDGNMLNIPYIDLIKQMPRINPAEKVGHWILTDDDLVYCSECEDSYYSRPIDASWYYCPHCGARMEVER